ncbi:transcriptional regulator [Desulfosporosinus fructosivorans]|uniref:Transcriptional regulator n=1 Tax=Desulfosporosinus fructosivorans TaxID=2018669 RepID=A0A4Z0R094_9FIRM|nr:helix-turn-helix domain-containing protein [Desulfosporosinus fructosivorans]TGE36178.1 transcriptional regulator [Desulfosporosinus fructosivorans]
MSDNYTFEQFLQDIHQTVPNNDSQICPVTRTLNLLQGKWKNHILYEMFKHDSIRFGEFKKAIPAITNTMLISSLRELEENHLVNRVQYNEIPPHVEYSLTETGKALLPIFYEMFKWGMNYPISCK